MQTADRELQGGVGVGSNGESGYGEWFPGGEGSVVGNVREGEGGGGTTEGTGHGTGDSVDVATGEGEGAGGGETEERGGGAVESEGGDSVERDHDQEGVPRHQPGVQQIA